MSLSCPRRRTGDELHPIVDPSGGLWSELRQMGLDVCGRSGLKFWQCAHQQGVECLNVKRRQSQCGKLCRLPHHVSRLRRSEVALRLPDGYIDIGLSG